MLGEKVILSTSLVLQIDLMDKSKFKIKGGKLISELMKLKIQLFRPPSKKLIKEINQLTFYLR